MVKIYVFSGDQLGQAIDEALSNYNWSEATGTDNRVEQWQIIYQGLIKIPEISLMTTRFQDIHPDPNQVHVFDGTGFPAVNFDIKKKVGRPSDVSVFTPHVPEPPVVSVFNPSINSAFAEPEPPVVSVFTQPEPEPQVVSFIPPTNYDKWYVQIIHIGTGVISFEGVVVRSNIDSFVSNTAYRVIFDPLYSEPEPEPEVSFIPPVFAEPEPEVIEYPLSANVRILFTDSNIGMFSSSIPIGDVGELQALSNASNVWNYTLIGSSTNQPLLSLSGLINMINDMIPSVTTVHVPSPGIEEPSTTTDHVAPPSMTVEELPVTVTPTEPQRVNWIPEPFFSFINNVFRK